MAQKEKLSVAVSLETSVIDTAAGVISGVSVITEGPALGHGMQIDATTLQQVKAAAEAFTGGLRVKMNHFGGAADIVGSLRNFRIVGKQLLADLVLLKTSQYRGYILELAIEIPHTFGLSISFSGTSEKRDGVSYARCTEIYSADLVDEPAANPTGLFDAAGKGNGKSTTPAPEPSKIITMPESDKTDLTAQYTELAKKFEEQSARIVKLEADQTALKADLTAKVGEAYTKGATEALTLFAAKFGAPPASGISHPPIPPVTAEKKFEDIVKAKTVELKSNPQAIKWAMQNHPTEYAAFQARQKAGENISLYF